MNCLVDEKDHKHCYLQIIIENISILKESFSMRFDVDTFKKHLFQN